MYTVYLNGEAFYCGVPLKDALKYSGDLRRAYKDADVFVKKD